MHRTTLPHRLQVLHRAGLAASALLLALAVAPATAADTGAGTGTTPPANPPATGTPDNGATPPAPAPAQKPKKAPVVRGQIEGIDTTAKTFQVKTPKKKAPLITITLTDTTSYLIDGTPSTLADVKMGDKVEIKLTPGTHEAMQVKVHRTAPANHGAPPAHGGGGPKNAPPPGAPATGTPGVGTNPGTSQPPATP